MPQPPVRTACLEVSASGAAGYPAPDLPEIAFLGRSNVGKSSLLNRLVGRRKLARTSATPGKTRLLHFFRIERASLVLRFVDFPGYGYARVSQRERAAWRPMVEAYLANRATLRLVVLLHDVRRDPSDDESLLLAWLAERERPTVVALTKVDKLRRMRRAERTRALVSAFMLPKECVVPTSAVTGEGTGALWEVIERAAAGRAL